MIIASHIIFGAYGFWLPNDPRGSWSDFVAGWELFRFGPVVHPGTTRSVAHVQHDQQRRLAAKAELKFPAVEFTGLQAAAIGKGFAEAVKQSSYQIHACSILPEHIHLVVARHRHEVTQIMNHLKGRATSQLRGKNLWADDERPVWARNGWKVYLKTPEDVRRAIRYVEDNPQKEGKPRQTWSFVTGFEPPD